MSFACFSNISNFSLHHLFCKTTFQCQRWNFTCIQLLEINIYAYPREKSNNFLNNELKLLIILQNTLYQVFYRVLNTLLSYASYHISIFPGNQRGHLRSCQNTTRNVFWHYFSKNFLHELLTGPFIQLCIRLFFGSFSLFGKISCICTKTA